MTALESSSSTLALAGLNVVIEDEQDYVFVAGDLLDEDDAASEWDIDSYDHCDLSPTLSCATSVATNVTLGMMDDELNGCVVATGEGEGRDDASQGGSQRKVNGIFPFNPKNGRRISNKKLRKKVKMMKKAAAAKALERQQQQQLQSQAPSLASVVAEEEQRKSPSSPSSPGKRTKGRVKSSPKRTKVHPNIQVACAQETLAAYREEVEAGKAQKKIARSNFVM